MSQEPISPDSTVSVMVLRTVKPGCEEEYERALHDLHQSSLREVPGDLGVYILRPPPGSKSREYGIIHRFANDADRDAFYRSPLFVNWKTRVAPLVEGDPIYNTMCGLETWFTLPGQEMTAVPPRWKMALVTWLGVYPTILMLTLVVEPLVRPLHITIKTVVISGIAVSLLSWAVMPVLTRVFWNWLYLGRR